MNRSFVYLPGLARYLNLANVVTIEEQYDDYLIRTTAPDGSVTSEGNLSPDHYTIRVKIDGPDCTILLRALDRLDVLNVEAATPEGM